MPENLNRPSDSITGQVLSFGSSGLVVSTEIGQVCGSCSAKCGVRQSPFSVSIAARTEIPLQDGQAVFLVLDRGALAQISLSLYLIPALGLLAGAFCSYSMGGGDLSQAAAGIFGFALGLLSARFILRRMYPAGAPLCAKQLTDK